MKKKIILVIGLSLIIGLMSGCGNKDKNNDAENTSGTTEVTTEAGTEQNNPDSKDTVLPQLEDPQPGDDIAIIDTNMGVIKVRFFGELAPKAVENFITHSKDGYYDGIIFHRVINNFMIQGGDPEGTGTGGESIWGEPFESEVSPSLRNFRGALCMANAGPDTNGSQFFIVQNPKLDDRTVSELNEILKRQDEPANPGDTSSNVKYKDIWPEAVVNEYLKNGGYPSLDFGYTVFGQVIEGMDVVDKIAAVETDDSDKPLEEVIIKKIDVTKYEG